MKNAIKIFFIILALLLLIGIILIFSSFGRRVPVNAPETIGNTAGNLNNGGYFCEDEEGTVFFANFYDHGVLYAMNADETQIRKLSDTKISYLNTAGNYIYYYMPDSMSSTGLGFVRRVVGIYRCTKKATQVTTLTREPAENLLLSGSRLFYRDAADKKTWKFSSIDLSGKSKETLMPYSINPASCNNGIIYFADEKENHFLCSYDTNTGNKQQLLRYNVWAPVYANGLIYFMDIQNNYRLCSYSLADGEVRIITNDRIDFYNVTEEYIYYQKSSETSPALKRVRLDGSGEEIVTEGTYRNLSATSNFLYFRDFNDDVTIYHTPINGPVSVSEFISAKDAVKQKDAH